MTVIGWLQALVLLGVVVALMKPLGSFMARIFEGEKTFLTPVLRPVERCIYALSGIDEKDEMAWYTYAFAVLCFSAVGLGFLYLLLRTQQWLPFNPQHFPNFA